VDLFNTSKNILPFDGEANYHGPVMSLQDAERFYQCLLKDIDWQHDQANIFGKTIITKRKVAWYGQESFNYTYSNTTKSALPWTKELKELKEIVEKESGQTYNSCLLNLYHSGEEGMAYHSDGERDLKELGAIGSLSLGAERKFAFKHKSSRQRIDILLEKGSLLVMKGNTQEHWMHRLPPTKKVLTPRINLTFRTIVKP
jgi:alkylated DNA repair dioxygenase AlkB